MEITPENLTVKDRMNAILETLEGKESVTFFSLFEDQGHRLLIIVTFLGLLELTRLRLVQVFQAEPFGPILVMRGVSLIIGKELDGLEEA
jgi:segregation and condensation protein A